MLVKISSKLSVWNFIEYFKGKLSLIIFERYPNLKYNISMEIETFGGKGLFWKCIYIKYLNSKIYIQEQKKKIW